MSWSLQIVAGHLLSFIFKFSDNLKISDFGFATVFRNNGKERTLDTVCGTEQYIAPEVLSRRPYKAEPIDVWSCGIILVAMLAGGRCTISSDS